MHRPADARPGAVAVRAWRYAPTRHAGGSWLNMAESIERVLKRRRSTVSIRSAGDRELV